MKFLQALALVAAISSNAASPAHAADRQVDTTLPVLVVTTNGQRGACTHVKFQFTRRNGDPSPLTVAVIEDTPGGAGESVRASVWLAAMVAALDRRDDLCGVRLSLELSGEVDGPSAGAGVCLATLSAIDGRTFPTDCAATGTIMPDGTIGDVGGIAEKLKAAGRAGIRRVFVPTYVRFEKDASGQEVDLRRLATSLSIELIPVQNITQAYSLLHRDPPATKAMPERDVLELPTATEEVYKAKFQEHRRVGDELWNAIPAAEREQIASDATMKSLFIDELARAERAYRTGRLSSAVSSIWCRRLALEARQTNIKSLSNVRWENFRQQDLAGAIGQLDQVYRRTLGEFPELKGLLTGRVSGMSDASAQFYADFYDHFRLIGMNDQLQAGIDALVLEMAKPDVKDEDKKEHFQSIIALKCLQMFMARCVVDGCRAWPSEIEAIVRTLPRRAAADSAPAAERLFYSAHLAVSNSFNHDVVRAAALELKVTDDEAWASLATNDPTLAVHLRPATEARHLHEALPELTDASQRQFATAASAHLQARCLAAASGLMVKWGSLEVEITEEGDLRYGRTDVLNYLLTVARENALDAIAECRRLEIPCLQPIAYVESGDLSRDDIDADKVDVLIDYWSASLQAKVLLMLCGNTKNEPPPAAAGGRISLTAPPNPWATAGNHALSPFATGTSRANPLLWPTGQSSAGTPRFVGVPIYRAPAKPVLPKNAPNTTNGTARAIVAALAALFFGGLAPLRRWLFGREKKDSPAADKSASDSKDHT